MTTTQVNQAKITRSTNLHILRPQDITCSLAGVMKNNPDVKITFS